MRLVVSSDVTGAIGTGKHSPIMRRACLNAEDTTTHAALLEVRSTLGRVLQHPTGYYESRVVADYRSRPPSVHDSRVVYGPWLEGIGSRNATTRFKGYHTFRLVAQRLQGRVVTITAPVFDHAVAELNR